MWWIRGFKPSEREVHQSPQFCAGNNGKQFYLHSPHICITSEVCQYRISLRSYMESTDTNSSQPQSKVLVSLSLFSWKSQIPITFLCLCVPNRKKKKNTDFRAKFHWRLEVKYGFHCIEFHETAGWSTASRADIPYQISPRTVKKCWKYG